MLRALRGKEIRQLKKNVKREYGSEAMLDYALFVNNEGRIFAVSKEVGKIDLSKIKINTIGLYFGKYEKGEIRLSIEGSQLVNPTKNFLNLTSDDAKKWIRGKDIELKENEGIEQSRKYVVLESFKDILGCGLLKGNALKNMVPKERRIKREENPLLISNPASKTA